MNRVWNGEHAGLWFPNFANSEGLDIRFGWENGILRNWFEEILVRIMFYVEGFAFVFIFRFCCLSWLKAFSVFRMNIRCSVKNKFVATQNKTWKFRVDSSNSSIRIVSVFSAILLLLLQLNARFLNTACRFKLKQSTRRDKILIIIEHFQSKHSQIAHLLNYNIIQCRSLLKLSFSFFPLNVERSRWTCSIRSEWLSSEYWIETVLYWLPQMRNIMLHNRTR